MLSRSAAFTMTKSPKKGCYREAMLSVAAVPSPFELHIRRSEVGCFCTCAFFNNKFAVKYKGRKVKSQFYLTVLRFLNCKTRCLGEKLACLVRNALSNKVTGEW